MKKSKKPSVVKKRAGKKKPASSSSPAPSVAAKLATVGTALKAGYHAGAAYGERAESIVAALSTPVVVAVAALVVTTGFIVGYVKSLASALMRSVSSLSRGLRNGAQRLLTSVKSLAGRVSQRLSSIFNRNKTSVSATSSQTKKAVRK